MKLKDLLAEGARLKKAMSLKALALKHGVPRDQIKKQVETGAQTEREHTTSNKTASTIARHHVAELPDYYDRLKGIESKKRKLSVWSRK